MSEDYDNKIVIDIDGTLCPIKKPEQDYRDLTPDKDVVNAIRKWRVKGFKIIFFTARNMRTYSGNLGEINKNTAPLLHEWLKRHDIDYDEIIFGKPWPGPKGFYVDDRTLRPDEFISMSDDEIPELLKQSATK